ncbi:MAG: type I 3-dehydroquinate dehydratase [Erysipelotrichaceae bacterium]|nr:type I 3-dehydroquinate dehydratase [Erysipelotrichaceae bacterium]MDD3809398.1 type I 3-dehydroquinate dehydratase [Erysipelotrichaceae bacterium]
MKECKVNDLVLNNEKSRICVPVTQKSDIDIIEQIKSLQTKGIDLIELRIDCFENVKDDEALTTLSNNIKMINQLPIIFTLRTRNEGGNLHVEPREYAHIIEVAIQTGAYEIYDIELLINDSVVIDLVAKIHERGKKVIMSNHDFHRTPSINTMSMRFMKMASFNGDILKIAVTPSNYLDVLKILEFTDECNTIFNVPVVVIAMGKLGVLTRMTGSLFGSAITFAKVGDGSAPGQVDLEDLKTAMNILEKYSL